MLQLMHVLVIFLVFNLFGYSYSLIQSLNGAWTVENANQSYTATASVPGGIYSDLLSSGILQSGDIFYRNNDREYRWVSKDDWTYQQIFEVGNDIWSKDNVFLVLHGVDAVATVYINDVVVGSCDNMFVRYRFPVKDHLKLGENIVKVAFQSPITAANERFEEQAKLYEVPPLCVPQEYQGECHANHLRKMQASFSWDWGPAFPSAGLWKSVELEAYDTLVIRDVTATLTEGASEWELQLDVFMEASLNSISIAGNLVASIQLQEETYIVATRNDTFQPDVEGECNSLISLTIPKDQVDLWWPNGFGAQRLYAITVLFTGDDQSTSEHQFTFGFRTIELIQELVGPTDVTGLSFYFRVNHMPIFMKGSNWIPSHILPELSYERDVLYNLLNAAKVANMNMLRVWGGGLYESQLFYQIADELGILIWQDLMFACSMYPTSPDFLKSVSLEVKQQIRQLQHHPSIAIWAGNNENEAALRDNWYGTGSNFNLYKEDYVKLYVDAIRPVVKLMDTSRPFVVSSPSNGKRSEEEGFVSVNPYNPLYGDLHYYNYISDGWDGNIYPRGRFISEYGFQSMPSFRSLAAVSVSSDWSISSEFSQRRQHHPAGYEEIELQIKKHMALPSDHNDYFKVYIYLSQINQAMSTKTESERYRKNRNLLTSNGEGLTMGALYWQLNDIWQGPSWASIEFGGRWKMLHYFAKDFFAPILVSAHTTADGMVQVYAISDHLEDINDVNLKIEVFNWNSLTPTYTREINHKLLGATATKVVDVDENDILSTAGCGTDTSAKLKCLLYFSLVDGEGNKISPDNFLFLGPVHSAIGLEKAHITVTDIIGPVADGVFGQFDITVMSDNIALFVWLEADNTTGQFSTNGFLMAEVSKKVQFHTEEQITSDELRNRIIIKSLTDTLM